MIDYANALKKLSSIRQEHIISDWNAFTDKQQKALLAQIHDLDAPLFLEQQALIYENTRGEEETYDPLDRVSNCGNKEAALIGRDALKRGEVGALIVAGGQGTRLGFNHPKGMFPITKIKQKSLFQIFLEKTIAAGKRAQKNLPIAFMTSLENDQETKSFLEEHKFFGSAEVGFFSQGSLPLLNAEGNLFLNPKGMIASGPDGNGSLIDHFTQSPLFEAWKKQGVRYVVFSLIDNPLADPFDEELVGKMIQGKLDVVIKAIDRENPNEKVGILVKNRKSVQVVEYTEFPKNLSCLRKDDGTLLFNLANISLFCLSMDFIEKVKNTYFKKMPLHKAFKANAWKFERYIFDMLPFAMNVETVVYPRNMCFSPLKNPDGDASPETVQKDLVASDRRVLEDLLGSSPPAEIQEIAQEYYYPTEEIVKNAKSILKVHTSYLEVI